jgi:hypothetical protein
MFCMGNVSFNTCMMFAVALHAMHWQIWCHVGSLLLVFYPWNTHVVSEFMLAT